MKYKSNMGGVVLELPSYGDGGVGFVNFEMPDAFAHITRIRVTNLGNDLNGVAGIRTEPGGTSGVPITRSEGIAPPTTQQYDSVEESRINVKAATTTPGQVCSAFKTVGSDHLQVIVEWLLL